jgi:hypothetical protein
VLYTQHSTRRRLAQLAELVDVSVPDAETVAVLARLQSRDQLQQVADALLAQRVTPNEIVIAAADLARSRRGSSMSCASSGPTWSRCPPPPAGAT